jgi:predicted dehydrogenase
MAPRVGIAGYGLAGRYFHAPLLRGAGFEVAAILTTNSARISNAKTDFPQAEIVGNIDDLLNCKLDLLVVASTNDAHAKQAIASLKAGVPVVVDKPMGRTLKETQEIIDVSKQTGVPVTTYFNRKWDSDSLTIKKVLADGVLGKIFRLESRFEVFKPRLKGDSWRENQSAAEGGGNLLDLQPHLLSTALDWFGPAELISSSVRSIRGASDDDIVLVLKHKNGVDSYLSASAIMGAAGPRIRLVGDQATLIIQELDPQESLLKAGGQPVDGKWQQSTKSQAFIHKGSEVIPFPSIDGNYTEFYSLVKAALTGAAWPVTTDEALAVAKIIDQAREISFR